MSKNVYSLPIKEKDIEGIPKNSPAHVGELKNSIDFSCKEGTPLFAIQDGIVVWVKQDSKVGGANKKYWDDGNRVTIKHKNKEYSAYEHLRFNGATVKVGDKVKKGDLIGYSGNTGFTFGPHLHFEIFIFEDEKNKKGFQTIVPKFDKESLKIFKKFQ